MDRYGVMRPLIQYSVGQQYQLIAVLLYVVHHSKDLILEVRFSSILEIEFIPHIGKSFLIFCNFLKRISPNGVTARVAGWDERKMTSHVLTVGQISQHVSPEKLLK